MKYTKMIIIASLATITFFHFIPPSPPPIEMVKFNNNTKPHSILLPLLVKPKRQLIVWEDEMVKGVKNFESFKSNPYYCPAGKLTVGYGHTGKYASQSVSRSKAESLLKEELKKAKALVQKHVKVPLTDYQLCSLTSFTYNCGEKNLIKLVNGKNRLNTGNYSSVTKLLPLYRKGGNKVLKGLEKRRKWEVELWQGEFTLNDEHLVFN